MDPSGQTDQDPNRQTQEWFQSIPSASAPLPPVQNKSNKRLTAAIVIGVIFILLIALSVGIVYFLQSTKKIACLGPRDYSTLAGLTTNDPVDAREGLYTLPVTFNAGSSTATTPSELDTFAKKLGKLYAEKANSSSIIVTIDSDYVDTESEAVASQRSNKIAQTLSENSVSRSAITINKPTKIELEEDTDPEYTSLITVSSAQSCQM